MADKEKKTKAIIDIWKLNNLVIFNVYLFLLQSDIIASIQGYTNLAILNIASFFY